MLLRLLSQSGKRRESEKGKLRKPPALPKAFEALRVSRVGK